MTPQISDSLGPSVYSYRQPSLAYKAGEKTISGKVDGLESIKQSVRNILATERYSSPIYDDGYGVELEQYRGKDFGAVLAGIGRTLSDALLQDDRITDVRVDDVSRTGIDSCKVEFTIFTIYGSYGEELDVIS